MLTFDGITLRLGGHLVLDRASAALPPRSRVGLVGRNGAGKSSLLKLIAGIYEADDGTIDAPSGMRIGYVAQEAPGGEATPFETVLAAATERTSLLEEAEHASDPHRIAEIHERLNAIDAHGAPARAARILAGLGFDEEAQHRPLDTFSGGWRMRVALAALLFSEPDLLLLDEPSNHLDLEAALWLESFLKSYRASLIVVSHERDLLNSVPDHILHLNRGTLSLYPGNYDAFVKLRGEREAQTEAARAAQEAKAKKLQAYVDRWRYKAHTARQAQSRLKALAKLQPVAAAGEDASVVFDFPSPKELRPPLIVLDDAAVGYAADTPVLSRLNLRIDPDDRIALVGRNGNGKTTLARLLAGRGRKDRGHAQQGVGLAGVQLQDSAGTAPGLRARGSDHAAVDPRLQRAPRLHDADLGPDRRQTPYSSICCLASTLASTTYRNYKSLYLKFVLI
jgi:ATP-binding cassette subfamily F protein 3